MTSTTRSSSQPLAAADRPQHSGPIVVGVDGVAGIAKRPTVGAKHGHAIPVYAVLAWQYHPSWADPGLGSMFRWALGRTWA
jgi:hypothetical protein